MNIQHILKIRLARTIAGAALFALVSLTAQQATAKDYTFSWSANPPPVTGYRFYYKKEGLAGAPFYGTDASEGSSPIDIGNQTTFTISGLDESAIYHFALKAYSSDMESDFTETITVTPGDSPSLSPVLLLNTINLLLLGDEE